MKTINELNLNYWTLLFVAFLGLTIFLSIQIIEEKLFVEIMKIKFVNFQENFNNLVRTTEFLLKENINGYLSPKIEQQNDFITAKFQLLLPSAFSLR